LEHQFQPIPNLYHKLQFYDVVRNEENYRQWEPKAKRFETSFTDESPNAGENRYYLRIEQVDGNMAWSSPVWVQVK